MSKVKSLGGQYGITQYPKPIEDRIADKLTGITEIPGTYIVRIDASGNVEVEEVADDCDCSSFSVPPGSRMLF